MADNKQQNNIVEEVKRSISAPVVQIVVSPTTIEEIPRDYLYLEFHVYDLNDNLIASNYNTQGWSYLENERKISFNILNTLYNLGFTSGRYKVKFRLFQNLVGSFKHKLYIDEIGSSKKEIRVRPYNDNDILISDYFDFFLVSNKDKAGNILQPLINLGKNRIYRIINWQPDFIKTPKTPYSLVLKLETELPDEIVEKDQLYISVSNSEEIVEIVNIETTNKEKELTVLSYANFKAKSDTNSVKKELDYHNWTSLVSPNTDVSRKIITKYFGSALDGIELNIDFRNFENFIYYSSAEYRLNNFKYKMELLESYDDSINSLYNISVPSSSVTSSTEFISNVAKYNSRKSDLIGSFDSYERYLYYESGSYSTSSYGEFYPCTWPKSTSTKPYTLFSVTSSEATSWFSGMIDSASLFDRLNKYALVRAIPSHIREDEYSDDFETFTQLIAQHFDTLWLYTKQFEKIPDRNESLYEGMSKELVFNVLKSFGWDPTSEYQFEDLWKYDIGTNSNWEYQPTSSYSVGEQVIYVESESMPRGDISKETWKRILNNLPYLLKSKGTMEGVYGLLNCYGVPRTLLNVREYGGPSKISEKSYWYLDKFGYAINLDGSLETRVQIPRQTLSETGIHANSIEFRFKTVDADDYEGELPTEYANMALLSSADQGVVFSLRHTTGNKGYLDLLVEGTGPDYTFSLGEGEFFDGQWWSFLFRHNELTDSLVSATFDLFAKKGTYYEITHEYTQSCTITSASNLNNLWAGQDYYLGGETFGSYSAFTGQMQEFRMWAEPLSEDAFDTHVLSPTSYNGTYSGSAFEKLAFRLPLGTDLRTYDHSLTSSLPNKNPDQKSAQFIGGYLTASVENFASGNSYIPIYDYYAMSWPDISANRRMSNKIRLDDNVLVKDLDLYGRSEISAYDKFPNDTPKIGVYLSPTNEVDQDIAEQFGGFRIDDYIGEWDDIYETYYPDLEHLRRHYFQKYQGKFNVRDYLRLADYFDNSMFKQIKKILPARSTKLVGVVIEPHILNRSKIKILTAKPGVDTHDFYGLLNTLPETLSGLYSYEEGSVLMNPTPVTAEMSNFSTTFVGKAETSLYAGSLDISDYDWDDFSNVHAIQATIYSSRTSSKYNKKTYYYATSSLNPAGDASQPGIDDPSSQWVDINNMRGVPNSTFSHVYSDVNLTTEKAKLTGFGFTIPNTAIISAIEIRVTGNKYVELGASGSVSDSTIKLLYNGAEISNNVRKEGDWGASDVVRIYSGDVSTYWGATLTPAKVNHSSFGMEIEVRIQNGSGREIGPEVDAVQIKITYFEEVIETVEVQDYVPESIKNLYWKGTRQTATAVNVKSMDTPDGGPIVEFSITNPNEMSVKSPDSTGNLKVG